MGSASAPKIYDPELLAIEALSSSPDMVAYFTGVGTAALTPLTAGARLLIAVALPVANAAQAAVTLGNVNGAIAALTIGISPTQGQVTALRDACEVLADDVRALSVLIHQMRADLITAGILKGSA